MFAMCMKHVRSGRALVLACLLIILSLLSKPDTRPLSEDLGAIHLYQLLTKLGSTARILHTVAHPDDEDGGMLTLESRGKGATALLLTVTRGEGGQNKFGTESSDELGILRTLELLQADKYYGVEQRFSHVVDFGYSKTAEETFQKWHGHDIALGDMVRTIRLFRPDVILSRFQGNKNDGHGNHEAAGILTREAFRAAGDPSRFPEQIKEGMLPWQAKKLYVDGFRLDQDYTIKLNIGEYSPVLGMSYTQFALEGLAHQTSQGTGGIRVPPGPRNAYYKLVDSVLPKPWPEHENDFFDGIDTSLTGLAARVGPEEIKVPFLRAGLESLQKHVDTAIKEFSIREPSACAPALLAGRNETEQLFNQISTSQLSPPVKEELETALATKLGEFAEAANEALGIFFDASVDQPGPPPAPSYFPRMEQTMSLALPGQTFTLTARLYNRGRLAVTPGEVQLHMPSGWKSEVLKHDDRQLQPGEMSATQFKIMVPDNAAYTRPYWSRSDPEKETVYKISDPQSITLPYTPYPVPVSASYSASGMKGETSALAKIKFIDPALGQSERPLVVGPPISVLLNNPIVVIPVTGAGKAAIEVNVRSNVEGRVHATLRLDVPQGWNAEPATISVDLQHDGDVNNYTFHITPRDLRERAYQVTAQAEYNGKQYSEGFKIITRPDLDSLYYYRPATQNVQAVDVSLPGHLKVGYIMGAGDEIPSVLASVGLNVSMITPQELASGDLSRYDTIIVGIRAYDVRTDIREQNRRLLDFVDRGGTLLVQYNQSVGIFNQGHYTPYPAALSNARVSVEEQPVEVLVPQERLFSYPNKITNRDFDGWVQERGLYFMSEWDAHFTPLLSSNDPGEAPQKGGLLLAHYGKGTYIYSGYAFFRQLPAGVPGAIRLFVNLVSAGHKSTGPSGK